VTPEDEEICKLREKVVELRERIAGMDKALSVARAHSISIFSAIISILALLVSLSYFLGHR
jgi:hypothetical protein